MDHATTRSQYPASQRPRRVTASAPRSRHSRNALSSHRQVSQSGRRLRVVFCIDNMGVGGTELNALRTAERLDRSRFDISIVCLKGDGPLLSRYQQHGISVLALPLRRLPSATAVWQGIRLARYLSRERVDVVHSHDIYNNIFATAWARVARTPVVIASRRWWDDVPRPSLRAINRYAFRWAHCVIANSPTVEKLVVDDDGVAPERVAVVPNFVDERAFSPFSAAERVHRLDAFGVPRDSMVIGCIAGLRPVKDLPTLIRAVVSLRSRWPLRLVLVGDGDARASLEQLARSLGAAQIVHFTGAQPNEPNLHHLFDISALCSLSEAFPNSIIEAMAAGRPVVATRVGGVVDAVVDGETGVLVPPQNVEQLAGAIERLLLDPELRRAMGEAARQRARKQFHASRVIPELEALYDRLLSSRVARGSAAVDR